MEKKKKRRARGSVFSRTMLMLLFLSLVTVLAMLFFVNYIVSQNQKNRIRTVHEDQLKQVAVYVDGQISAVEQDNAQLIHGTDVISLMVNPRRKDSDVGYHVISALKNSTEQNNMVRRAFLYLPTTGEVYSFTGSASSLEDFSGRKDIEYYLELREQGRTSGAESEHRLMFRNRRLYVVTDFCVPIFIGALFQEVDLDLLNSSIQGSSKEPLESFFVLGASGGIILAQEEVQAELKEVLKNRSYTDARNPERGGREDYMIYASSENTLTYGIHVAPSSGWLNVETMLWTVVPFLLIYAVLSVLYSLSITRRIYAPINRLMQITAAERTDMNRLFNDRGRNELELLEEAFQSTLGENRQHKELLADISQDVLSQMFRGILTGTVAEPDYIRSRMEGLGLSRFRTGRFQALAGIIRPMEKRELSSVEEGLYQRSLLAVLAECQGDDFLLISFFMDADHLAVLLCFPQEESALQIKTRVGKLQEEVLEKVAQLPYTVVFGRGKLCNEISSLRFSWQEALEEVQYQIYLEDTPQQERKERPSRTDDADLVYFREQAAHLAARAEKERMETISAMAGSLAREFTDCDAGRRAVILESVMDVLYEKLIEAHLTPEEIQEMHLTEKGEQALSSEDAGEMGQLVGEMLLAAAGMIHTNSRKSRYRYVDSAKEYISAHYSDGNLSLIEVSEAVGISAPYLSAIFAEISKGGFSAYLSSFRVEKARVFLEESAESVADIGYRCGFNSAQSFSRVFKKITGMAPGQYRERYSRQEEQV